MRSPCLEPRCPDLAVPKGRGRCGQHAKQRDKGINRAGRALYGTKRWKILRRHKLGLTPLCEWDGCEEIATDVHHKHGVEADPWSLDGLESLCHAHHSQISRRNQLERSA